MLSLFQILGSGQKKGTATFLTVPVVHVKLWANWALLEDPIRRGVLVVMVAAEGVAMPASKRHGPSGDHPPAHFDVLGFRIGLAVGELKSSSVGISHPGYGEYMRYVPENVNALKVSPSVVEV